MIEDFTNYGNYPLRSNHSFYESIILKCGPKKRIFMRTINVCYDNSFSIYKYYRVKHQQEHAAQNKFTLCLVFQTNKCV